MEKILTIMINLYINFMNLTLFLRVFGEIRNDFMITALFEKGDQSKILNSQALKHANETKLKLNMTWLKLIAKFSPFEISQSTILKI